MKSYGIRLVSAERKQISWGAEDFAHLLSKVMCVSIEQLASPLYGHSLVLPHPASAPNLQIYLKINTLCLVLRERPLIFLKTSLGSSQNIPPFAGNTVNFEILH